MLHCVSRIKRRLPQCSASVQAGNPIGASRTIFSIQPTISNNYNILLCQNVLTPNRTNERRRSIGYQSRRVSIGLSSLSSRSISDQRAQESVVSGCNADKAETSMRDSAVYLLTLPQGTMENRTWIKAEETLNWWISQCTEESVDVSINLLERLLKETLVDTSAANQMEIFLDTRIVTTLVLNWFCLWKVKDFSWTPFRFFKTLDNFHQTAPHVRGLEITVPLVSYIINGLKVRRNPCKSAETADELLHYCLENPGGMDRSGLFRYLIQIVLDLWGKSGRSDSVHRAEITFSILRELDSRILDIAAYNAMLDVYSQSGNNTKAEALLEAMALEWLQDWHLPRPNTTSIAATVLAWMHSGDPNAPERATQLVGRLKDPLDPLGRLGITPDAAIFNSLLQTWANSGRQEAPRQAYAFLDMMADSGYEGVNPDSFSYSIVADAFAKSGDPQTAERIIEELCSLYVRDNGEHLSLLPEMFPDLMEAWMRSKETDREQKVREILDGVKRLHKQGHLQQAPETILFNKVLSCIVSSEQINKAKQADNFLQEMKLMYQNGEMCGRLSDWSYALVITAYVQTPEGLERAKELLMEALENGVTFSLNTAGYLIQVLLKSGNTNDADVWLHRIFDGIEEGIFYGGKEPASSLIHAVLNGWVQATRYDKDAIFKALTLLERLTKLKEKCLLEHSPDLTIFKLVQDICLESDHEEAPDHAYKVIEHMLKQGNDGDPVMMPDYSMYAQVISGYKKAQKPESAELVFRGMLNCYLKGNQTAKPDLPVLNDVLLSWMEFGKSVAAIESDFLLRWAESRKSIAAGERVFSLLQKIQALSKSGRLDLQPTQQMYDVAMSTCLKEKGGAARVIILFEQMKQSYLSGNKNAMPGTFSYSCVIEALVRDGNPDRAETYIREACSAYQVGHLCQPPSDDLFNQVIKALEKRTKKRRQSLYPQGCQTNSKRETLHILAKQMKEQCLSRVLPLGS